MAEETQTKKQRELELKAQQFVAENPPRSGTSGTGKRVTLPSGKSRVDYIRERATEGLSTSQIRAEINHMYKADHTASGAPGKAPEVSYQVVYQVVKATRDALEADEAGDADAA